MSLILSAKKKLLLNQLIISATLLIVLSTNSSLLADDLKYLDPENTQLELGREADGQAYRKDADGTKIVDYIAELELSSLELTRALSAAQDENSSLRLEIERLKSGRSEFVIESELPTAQKDKDVQQIETLQDCSSFNRQAQELQEKLRTCHDSLDLENLAKQKIESELKELRNSQEFQAQTSFTERISDLQIQFQQLLLLKDSRDLLINEKRTDEDNQILTELDRSPQDLSVAAMSELERKLKKSENETDLDQIQTELTRLSAKIQAQIELLN